MPNFSVNELEKILKRLPGTRAKITSDGRKMLAAMAQVSKGPYVAVGITQEKFNVEKQVDPGEKSKYTIGEIAVVHEFGSKDGRIPERSFLRVPYMANFREMLSFIRELHKLVMSNRMKPEMALGRIGLKFENIVRDRIRSNIPPRLKPETIERKTRAGREGNVALVNVGQLLKTIGSAVNMNGKH